MLRVGHPLTGKFKVMIKTSSWFSRPLAGALLMVTVALGGCKLGESTESLPNTRAPGTTTYGGPPPATADVQSFKLSVWDNLVQPARCGDCHNSSGQSPRFVHEGDVNIAYAQANTVVNLGDPAESAMVAKVAGGHHCWLASDQACADTITNYIANWAGGSSGTVKTIDLRPPVLRDPGASKPFPESSAEFGSTVHPLLATYCSDCHSEGGTRPFLASFNVDLAYDAAKSRISLDNPSASRLVERLRDESHNCWEDNCPDSAFEMQMAIEFFAETIQPRELDSAIVASKALNLSTDGLLANAGGRYEDHVVALYEFKAGEGRTAFDTSGQEPAMHLSLTGNTDWVGGWGVSFGPAYTDDAGTSLRSGKAQATTGSSRKLHSLLTASGEYSIEAWVVPGNVTQEDARIVSYSGSANSRNFSLSQSLQNYGILQRSTTTDQNTAFSTADGDNRLQASLQHVVINFTPGEGRRIYVNGRDTGDTDPGAAGLLNNWDDTFAFVLGNETDGNSPWEGTLRLVAIHNRALSAEQIRTNYEAGVGQKYYLLFGVAHLIDVPQSYIVFEVSQFDSYSYLFTEPFFISLDDSASPGGIPLEGMKLGINGREAVVGQTWANLEVILNGNDYRPGSGQLLSSQGAVVALESGPDSDEFFLSFERLGSHTNVVVESSLPPAAPAANLPPAADVGLKTFDAINASMARVTGVARTEPAVAATYNTIRQQLPSVANIEGFLSSHQMAITQLAIRYCDSLVETPSLRNSFFPGFDFSLAADQAYSGTRRDLVVDPLISRMVGQNLASQPTDADVRAELEQLIDSLTACTGGCDTERTRTVAKASCAAVLGSAVTLIK